MNTLRRVAVLTLVATFFASGFAWAAKKPMKPQTTCPILGGKIDKSLYVDYEGKRIYVCCPGCIAEVKKDPAKYIEKLEAEGITLDKATIPQTTCPVMGGKINKNLFVEHGGKRIYACCPGCLPELKKDPAKYIKKLEDEGITLDRVIKPQTICPVMGGKIDKSLYVDHEGKRIYVCCEGCLAEVKKDPAKYIQKLEAEGIMLDKTPATKGKGTEVPVP